MIADIPNFFSGNSHPEDEPIDVREADRVFVRGMTHHFLSLVGGVVDYYGADSGEHEFKIDGIVFKVFEDPDDGYRSYLGTIEYSGSSRGIFFSHPISQVKIEVYQDETRGDEFSTGTCEGYKFIDVNDGHVWLEFGTDNTSDYYPYFVFRHWPKSTVQSSTAE